MQEYSPTPPFPAHPEANVPPSREPISLMESVCVTAKGEPDRNEDRLVVNDRFVAVIDGATSSKPINGKSGGIVAAQALADVFSQMEATATARDFVNRATTELSRRIGDWPDPQAMRPAAAFVAYSVLRREIWHVGDCHFRIDDREFSGEKEIDRVAYAFRCAVVRARIALGASSVERETSVATLEQPFMPLVEVQHAYCNIDAPDPLAYGAIDGRRVPDRYIEVYATSCFVQTDSFVLSQRLPRASKTSRVFALRIP